MYTWPEFDATMSQDNWRSLPARVDLVIDRLNNVDPVEVARPPKEKLLRLITADVRAWEIFNTIFGCTHCVYIVRTLTHAAIVYGRFSPFNKMIGCRGKLQVRNLGVGEERSLQNKELATRFGLHDCEVYVLDLIHL